MPIISSKKSNAGKSHLSTFLKITTLAARVVADKDFPNNSQNALRIYREAHSLTKTWLEDAERRLQHQESGRHPSSADEELRHILRGGGMRSLAAVLARVGPMAWKMLRSKNDNDRSRAGHEVAKEMHYLLSIIVEDTEEEVERLTGIVEGKNRGRGIFHQIAHQEGYEEKRDHEIKDSKYNSKYRPTSRPSQESSHKKDANIGSNREQKSKPHSRTSLAGPAKTKNSSSAECARRHQGYSGLPPPPIGFNFIQEDMTNPE